MKRQIVTFFLAFMTVFFTATTSRTEIQEVDTTSTRDVEKIRKSFSEKMIDVPGEIIKLPFYVTENVVHVASVNPPMSIILPLINFGKTAQKYIPIVGYSSTKGIKFGLGVRMPGIFYEDDKGKFKWYYSTNNYQSYKLTYRSDIFISERTGLDLKIHYMKRPRDRFYGLGQFSNTNNEANYCKESIEIDFKIPTLLFGKAGFELSGGYSATNLFDGEDDDFEGDLDSLVMNDIYNLEQEQFEKSRYFKFGGSLSIDSRDNRGKPIKGNHLIVGYTRYIGHDVSSGDDFGRLTFDLRHYQHIWLKRTFAVRLYLERTDISGEDDRNIPIYLAGSLGGVDQLRGYNRGRYIDNDLALASFEYRYPIYDYIDAFLFLDEGRVYNDITNEKLFNDWSHSFGFGLRMWSEEAVSVMVQIARSEEATRFYFDLGAEW